MALDPFATADDFADLIGTTLSAPSTARAGRLLGRASNRVREAAKQTISLVTDDEYVRAGTTEGRIVLPERPVVSVASVSINGQPISDWYLAGNALVRRGQFADRILYGFSDHVIDGFTHGGGFGCEQDTLRIVYTHGYAPPSIPELCRSISLEMVKRVWVNPGGVIQETVGPDQTIYAPFAEPPRGLALTSSERQEIRRFFGSIAGSVWTASAS